MLLLNPFKLCAYSCLAHFCISSLVAAGQLSIEPVPSSTNSEATYNLARKFAKGDGQPRDLVKAAELLRQAAEGGYAAAQTDLGAAYANGAGVPQDFRKAAEWYRKAAEQGDTLAEYTFGRSLLIGRGVATNIESGLGWLRRAADRGQPDAMLFLGDLYLNGLAGLSLDYTMAMHWFSNAVANGRISGLNSIGYLHEHGLGVPRNLQSAVESYRKAAEAGDARAQMNLGRMYLEGSGVGRDPVEARKWFELAVRHGELVAQHYIQEMQMHEELTPGQEAEADQKAGSYIEQHGVVSSPAAH